jgi:hypothetical protein
MDATTNLYLYPRKPMNLKTLLCTTDGAGTQRGGGPSIPMKIAIPECHSFSHAQTNPNKGHRRILGNHKVKLDFCMPAPSPPNSLSLKLPPSHFRSDRGHRKKIIFVDVARNGVN